MHTEEDAFAPQLFRTLQISEGILSSKTSNRAVHFFLCLHIVLPGSLHNAKSSAMLPKTGGFVWAFHVLSRPEPNEMSSRHSCSVQREAAHNSILARVCRS